MTDASLRETVSALLPSLLDELEALVRIPSVSKAGYPEETHAGLAEAQAAVTRLFADSGVERFDTIGPGTDGRPGEGAEAARPVREVEGAVTLYPHRSCCCEAAATRLLVGESCVPRELPYHRHGASA